MTEAASHNWQNFTDKQSVSLIENILSSHGRVMSHIDTVDKWPNIDGNVDLQSEDFKLVGRLYVQAKTLKTDSLKIACQTSFLSSCELDPCLLLAADNANRKIYWLYLDAIEVKKYALKPGQITKTITFDPQQYIDQNETSYVEEWIALAKKNQERLNNHDDLKEAYKNLSKRSNEAIGESHQDFKMLHKFLDELNSRLDNEFLSVKRRLFPDAWKLGLALYDYKDHELSYTIYPISSDKNDVQIKRVDKQLRDDLNAQGLGFRAHYVENPIEAKPREYAFDLIESYTMSLFNKRLLNDGNDELIALEYIFYIIDTCADSMKLTIADSYQVKELLENKWIKEHERIQFISYNSKQIDIRKFVRLLEKYAGKDRVVRRPYKRFDYTRGGGWVWNFYSKEDAEEVFLKVIKSWPSAYDDIIQNNFPLLEDELSLWGSGDLMLVKGNFSDSYEGHYGPTYETYLLKSKDGAPKFKRIEQAPEELLSQLRDYGRSRETIMFEGEPYSLTWASHSTLSLLYHDLPLANLVYETLDRRLKDYFSKERH